MVERFQFVQARAYDRATRFRIIGIVSQPDILLPIEPIGASNIALLRKGTAMDTKIQTLLDRKGHEVLSIRADQTVFEAIAEMDARHVGGLIVKDGARVVGIITERDYLRKVILKGRSSKETAVETIMTRHLESVTPDDTVEDAMRLMTEKRCRHLPVFKDGELDGIVSIGDLVKAIIAGQESEIQVFKDYISSR
jgi:CBS domain-containing protein